MLNVCIIRSSAYVSLYHICCIISKIGGEKTKGENRGETTWGETTSGGKCLGGETICYRPGELDFSTTRVSALRCSSLPP